MLTLILRPIRNVAAVLVANDSPRQIAAGAALGVVIGFVPKGNLIAIALLMLLLAIKVNRTAGLLAAGLFSWVGFMTDGFTHRLGAYLLSIESLQPYYAWTYELPLGPWVGFNNTVVLGSLVLGLYLSYPIYLLMMPFLSRYQAPVGAWIMRRRVTRWLLGAELTSRWSGPTGLGIG